MDKPTDVADVVLPQVLVTLDHVRTTTGQPVVVMCEALDELTISEITGALPGLTPARPGADGELDPVLAREATVLTDQRAQLLIERATFLTSADGDVRPAFWFNEATPRHPRSIPGRLLRQGDRIALLAGIMRAGNYLTGGPADKARFPDDGAGSSVGAGAGQAGGADEATGIRVAGLPAGTVEDGRGPDDAGAGDGSGPH